VIVNSTNIGVYNWFGANNRFLGNRIYGNAGAGIDLDPQGPWPNDVLDADHGPNEGQNYPVVLQATASAGNITVVGKLASAATTAYRIEFFYSPTCYASGFGQGTDFIGSLDVVTNAGGDVSYSPAIANAAVAGFITATATSSDGNTSEFSPCIALGPALAGEFNISRSPVLAYEDEKSVDVLVTRSKGLTGASSVTLTTSNLTAVAPGDYTLVNQTLNFAEGEAVKVVNIPVVLDEVVEGDEKFKITLSDPTNGATLGGQSAPEVLLFDHELQWPFLSIGDASVAEPVSGQAQVNIVIKLSAPTDHALNVSYTTHDASAKAGLDYLAASGALVFAIGEVEKMVPLTILADALPEGEEVFNVTIFAGGGQQVIGADSEGEVVITPPEAAELQFRDGFE